MPEFYTAKPDSTLPAVRALVDKLAANGKRLNYATVDDSGRIVGYQPVGGSLIIIPPPRAQFSTDSNASFTDYAADMQRNYLMDQMTSAIRPNGSDNRLLFFSLGIGALLMILLYSRGKK